MKMYNLLPLYHAMQQQKRTVEGFDFKLKGLTLDVVFAIDTQPFMLLIGIKTYNFFFTVPVYRGFWVEPLEDHIFYALRRLLNFSKKGEKFTSLKFLAEVNHYAPSHCSKIPLQPHHLYAMLPQEQREKVEESDKIYFLGWNYHRTDGRKARNFEKTRIMTGSQQIADFCRAHNISSMWSANPNDAKAFVNPSIMSNRIP